MEIVFMNGREYQKTIENGEVVLTREKNGFTTKTIFCGTQEDVEGFKRFVVNLMTKNY